MTGNKRWLVTSLAATLVVLLGSITAAVAWGGTWPVGTTSPMSSHARRANSIRPDASGAAAPSLPGTVLRISLTSMDGSMMGRPGGARPSVGMHAGVMHLNADRASVPHGTVSFLATNDARIDHELVVLPLPSGQSAGNRAVGDDNKVDEAGSLGEASQTNGAGVGGGVEPGASGWVSITLATGHYELVCNLPGHYSAGMYTEVDVT